MSKEKKCLFCSKAIKQTEGRRERKYCDNGGKCRQKHWVQKKKVVATNKYLSLPKEFDVRGNLYVVDENSIVVATFIDGEFKQTKPSVFSIRNKLTVPPTPKTKSTNKQLVDEYNLVKASKVPKDRDTFLGRKVFEKEKEQKLKDIELRMNKK